MPTHQMLTLKNSDMQDVAGSHLTVNPLAALTACNVLDETAPRCGTVLSVTRPRGGLSAPSHGYNETAKNIIEFP